MQLFVIGARQKGSDRSTFTLNDFSEEDTVRTLKLVISNKFCIPYDIFYLVAGKHLTRGTLGENNISNEQSIRVIFRACGSGDITMN